MSIFKTKEEINNGAKSKISIIEDTPGVTRDRIYTEINYLDYNTQIITLDVGQGDSTLIKYSYNKANILNVESKIKIRKL